MCKMGAIEAYGWYILLYIYIYGWYILAQVKYGVSKKKNVLGKIINFRTFGEMSVIYKPVSAIHMLSAIIYLTWHDS